MKCLIIIFTFLIIASFNLAAQDGFPLNLNGAYLAEYKGFSAIKTTKTYEGRNYNAETINYFDDKGLNFLTESYYKGEKQAKVNLFYNSQNKLIGYKYYYAGENDGDEAILAWENEYLYNTKGQVEKGVRQSYNKQQKPTYRSEVLINYDSLNRITEKVWKRYDLSDSQHQVYFEPNSTEISPNQEIQRTSTDARIYNYIGDTIRVKNYREKEHRTDQIISRVANIETKLLKSSSGDTLMITTITYNDENQVIEEVDSGDTEISIFGGYSDGMSYDIRKYDYSVSGLLSRITFINSKHGNKMFIDYDYIE